MGDRSDRKITLPSEQQAIRNKCFHPSGKFTEFPMEDVETSIPARFEKIVLSCPDRIAIRLAGQAITYDELNSQAKEKEQTLHSESNSL